ncbi:MAG: response regulator transcription factor [Candidatus Obscuribacterales bacterium]|nr:response regulator transcription factor [Candidatus Obscuribacterales bacterium]
MAKILVVDDEPDLLELICIGLRGKGYTVQACTGGADAMAMLRAYQFDVVVLDWMMPGITGIEVLRSYRQQGGKSPVILLTAKAFVDDKEKALDSGADDYLTKPFDMKELAARIRALLRRPAELQGNIICVGDLRIDVATCTVTVGDEEIVIRPRVMDLLFFLARHPNQTFTADALLKRVWLDDSAVSLNSVRAHIKLLRQSLGRQTADRVLRTVRGRGYMIVDNKQAELATRSSRRPRG